MNKMSRLEVVSNAPGISKVLQTFPVAAKPLMAFVDNVLRTMDSPLSLGERELLFTMASWTNGCVTDAGVHSQAAVTLLDDGADLLEVVRTQGPCALALINPKLHEMLHLVSDVTKMIGPQLSDHMERMAIRLARDVGCTDREIHDIVLIGSLAAMMNRYVDATTSDGRTLNIDFFRSEAQAIVKTGYAF